MRTSRRRTGDSCTRLFEPLSRSILPVKAAVAALAATVILALVIACGGASEPKHPSEVCGSDAVGGQSGQAQGGTQLPPGGPPSFPYIFHGNFEVDGKPGPAGVTMFARIGLAKSPTVATGAGTYRNIIIGPITPDDVEAELEIFLGEPGQSNVKADQSFKFTTVNVPSTFECDLSFPRLP